MVGIKCNFEKLLNRYTPEKVENARREMCDQMLSDMTPLVPYRKGALQGTGHVTEEGLEWNTPYAKAQFYGRDKNRTFRNYTTAGTGKRWDLKAESMYKANWKNVFAKELIRK